MAQLKRMFGAAARAALGVMLICLASGQASAASAASAGSWVLETQSGQVQLVKTGISPIALTPGDVFGGGAWIETGPDGRAVLRRGEETIVVAPNSRVGLPKDKTGPFATRILHTLGTILLTVEKKAKQHFEVQTPYLTAVVKGTTFTVGIQNGRSVVHVVEGLVQVKNLASGRSTLVRPGQTGAVMRDGAADVQVEGGVADGAPIDQAASSAPAVSETAAQAVSATPAVSVAATQVVSTTSTVETRGNSGVVKIEQALGAKTLDLTKSTKGLVRAASRAAPQAAVGKGPVASEMPGGSGLTTARANGGQALALGQSAKVAASSSKATGNGLALGRSTTATANLSQVRTTGLALGQSVSASLSNAGGNGVAPGQSASASLSNQTGNGRGLAVGQGLSPNPGLGQSNAGGNGNGKAKGHEK